ncbi:Hypothetical predicted protein [Olea europaea subsp. europaea]|uniref:Uncharacterized protein n=1 Tax=Olea europaea subsp. europaea TaxID=158383 RepID=A0A8S0SSS9_OLEEU|nr:Hypothetical predicted protein [Olea europaea subsp. europaea]
MVSAFDILFTSSFDIRGMNATMEDCGQPVGFSDNIKPEDINLRLVFHYGIPTRSMLLAYDSIQQILAIVTRDGRVKLFGKNGSQALLESSKEVLSNFLLVNGLYISLYFWVLFTLTEIYIL